MLDDRQEHPSRSMSLPAALLPIPDGGGANPEGHGKFFLGHSELDPDGMNIWHGDDEAPFCFRHLGGLAGRIRILMDLSLDILIRHPVDLGPVRLPDGSKGLSAGTSY
jgi:hypothetical protein